MTSEPRDSKLGLFASTSKTVLLDLAAVAT
jgi:hypothetical protein